MGFLSLPRGDGDKERLLLWLESMSLACGNGCAGWIEGNTLPGEWTLQGESGDPRKTVRRPRLPKRAWMRWQNVGMFPNAAGSRVTANGDQSTRYQSRWCSGGGPRRSHKWRGPTSDWAVVVVFGGLIRSEKALDLDVDYRRRGAR